MAGLQRLAQLENEIRARQQADKAKLLRTVLEKRSRHFSQTASASTDIGSHNQGGRDMWFYRKFIVRKHERGLLFRDGDFLKFLEPGTYRFIDFRKRYSFERFDLSTPAFEHRLVKYLLAAERDELEQRFEIVTTGSDEVAVVYHNDQIAAVLGPSDRKLYWRGVVELRVETFSLNEALALDARLAKRLVSGTDSRVMGLADKAVYARVVPDGHAGLLYVDGELSETLNSGLHAYWRYDRAINIELIDLRIKTLEVQGQEILTRDKVALRINLAATFQFVDAAKAVQAVKDPLDHLYKEVQFGLRAAVGARTLDALLEDKSVIDREVAEHLLSRFADIGIAIKSVGVKDIILPGDMKALLGKVVEAEKAAQANVIRRREETNATRSLLNTAKVMESNAVALRLKELETLEKVTEKIGNISVYGGLDSVLNGLVQLNKQ